MDSERQKIIGQIAMTAMAAVEENKADHEVRADMAKLLGALTVTQALLIRAAAAAVGMPQKSIIGSPDAQEIPEAVFVARNHLLRLADEIEAHVRADHDAFALLTRTGTYSSQRSNTSV